MSIHHLVLAICFWLVIQPATTICVCDPPIPASTSQFPSRAAPARLAQDPRSSFAAPAPKRATKRGTGGAELMSAPLNPITVRKSELQQKSASHAAASGRTRRHWRHHHLSLSNAMLIDLLLLLLLFDCVCCFNSNAENANSNSNWSDSPSKPLSPTGDGTTITTTGP